uniref:Uncharacterized protein n=1 Tax=Arundo donax TaxID=35708 RepID=A0A0A8Z0I6_ARUDO
MDRSGAARRRGSA